MIWQLQAQQNIITQSNFAPSSLLQIFSLFLGLTLNGSVSGLLQLAIYIYYDQGQVTGAYYHIHYE